MGKRKIILTNNAPQPRGPYSQAVIYGGMLFISGQGPVDPVTNKMINGTVEQETKRTLENIKAVINEAGGKLENTLKITCYLSDINNLSAFNNAYKDYFIKEPPARSTLEAKLPNGMKLEIDAIVALE